MLVGSVLAIAVAAAWLAATALLRLATPLERIHVVSFVNVATGSAIMLAAVLADGPSGRTLKVLLIWFVTLIGGALLSHATARALHVRSGERR